MESIVGRLLREYTRFVVAERRSRFDMEELRRARDPEEYLDFHAERLGSGLSRTAYGTGRGYVIKLANAGRGLQQNKDEFSRARCAPGAPVPRVYARAKDYSWIAVEEVTPLDGDALRRKLRDVLQDDSVSLAEFQALVNNATQGRADALHRELYRTNGWYASFFDMVVACDHDPFEMHEENWGIDRNGVLVLLDV